MAGQFILSDQDPRVPASPAETQKEYLDSLYGPGGSRPLNEELPAGLTEPPPLEDESPGPAGQFTLSDHDPRAAPPSPGAMPTSGPASDTGKDMLDQSPAFDPRSPIAPAGPRTQPPGDMALEGMSDLDRARAGAGKALVGAGHGLKQLAAEAGNFISDDLVPHETTERLRAEADETTTRDEALMADPNGQAGNILGHVATAIALPASRIPSAIASGTAYGAVQPVGAEESRTDNTLMGAGFGTLGSVGGRVVGRALHPVRSEVSRETAKLMLDAENVGFKLSAGQRTGNRHLRNAEAALDTLPTSGSPLGQWSGHNQQTANTIVGKEMGETVDAVTPEVIGAARGRIGGVMDSLTVGRNFDVDRPFFDTIFRIRTKYGQTLAGQQSAEIRSILDELAAGSGTRGPQITGEQYKRTVSSLKQEAEASFRSGTNVNDAEVKREIAEALEGLAERNLTGEELAAFQAARKQYSATLIAEKAVRPDGTGDIMIEKLHQATKQHRRVANRQGDDDELVRLGRVGQGLKKQLIQNSGTAERSWWLKAMQSPLSLAAGGGTAGYVAGGGDPGTALSGLAAPFLISRAMFSRPGQNWLREGVKFPGRNRLIEALSRTAPGAATGVTASEESAR